MSATTPTFFNAATVNMDTIKFIKWLENLSARLKHRVMALSEYDPRKDDDTEITNSIVYDDSTTEVHDFSSIVPKHISHKCKIAGNIFCNYVGENGESLLNPKISAGWYEGENCPGDNKDLVVRYNWSNDPKDGYISMEFENKDGGVDFITVEKDGWSISND